MNSVFEILSELKENGIFLSLDETQTNLKLKGNLSSLTDDNKDKIKKRKQVLIQFFKDNTNHSKNVIPKTEKESNKIQLAPNQKGIWFHEKIEDLGTAYIIPAIYFHELKDFNHDLFIKALDFLAEDNDVFRVVFGENEGDPFQEIKEHIEVKNHCEFKEVSGIEEIQHYIDIKSQTEFLATEQPVWDITVFELPKSSYCFYLRLHHLIGDGESLSIFIQKLIEVYTRLQTKVDLAKTEHLQYKDYVAWISEKENFKSSSVFWKKEFSNYEENFKPFYDKNLKNEGESIGNTHIFEYSEQQTSKLRNWAVTNRVSLASLYTAATSIVLSKRGNSNDFVVGIPTASRNHPQLSNVIGNLVNTLPLRLQIDYTLSQKEYVQEIQNRYLSVLEHQLYPFQYILEDIHYQRKAEENPLFDVMISVPNNVQTTASGKQIELLKKTSLYDLTFTFIELEKTIQLAVEYTTSKFELATIESIAKEIDTVFEQLINEKEKSLSKISLLTEADKQLIIESTGATNPIALEPHLTVLDLLQKQVNQTPTNIAVCSNSKTYTYQEFYTSAISLAHYLKTTQKLQEGARVALSIEKSIDQLISMYAIWFSGGIYVPIDLSLPTERKALILRDCEAQFCIDAQFIDTFKKQKTVNDHITELDSVSPTSLAYILYTSGTTGKPKGAMITHQNLANKIQEETEVLSINQETVTYTLTNSSFDVSFLETVLPISKGGKVVIPKEEILLDTEKTISDIAKYQVTHLQGTPTYFSHFVSLLTDDSIKDLKHLRFICIGGESLNAYLVQQLKKGLPHVKLNNHYGPTEITIDAIVKQDIFNFDKNSIGKPFGNVEGYVVDEFGNLLPKGVVGELVIGGSSVFLGYWGDEQLSKTKLKSVQFKTGTFYYTGDLVLLTEESEFEFIARKDTQIKLKGYRIELDEINQTLLKLEGVHQSVSRVIENVLVSWVVSELEESKIKEQLRSYLPEYMIPQSIEIMESFPMTENGKIAFNQLSKPKHIKKEYIAPRTELESQLVEIWQKVLGIEQVGVYDNFFELGGHSLKMTQLLSRYQNSFGVKLAIKDLFLNTTISSQSELIEKSGVKKQSEIILIPESADYQVSYSQNRMWLLSQMEGGSIAYNMPSTLRLKGNLDVSRFILSIESIIDKHEILRTGFKINENGELRQIIKTRKDIGFSVEVNLNETNLDFIENKLNQDLQIPFDFENGPLLRVALFQINETEFIFHYNMHHIISDGWSMEVLANEVLSNYYISDQVAPEGKLNIQYKDYAAWQRHEVEGNKRPQLYWKNKFKGGIPVLELPNQKLRPLIKSYNGKALPFELDAQTTELLKNYCQQHDGTLFMGLLATLNGLLNRYTQQKDIIIGTPIAGRSHYELENQIGMYVNTLALRTEFEPNDNFNKLFLNVKEVTLGAYEYQNYPIDKLIDELKLTRDFSRNSLFDVMLVLQNTDQSKSILSSPKNQLNISYEETSHTTSQFDLSFTISETDNKLIGTLVYDTNIYTEDFVKQLVIHYQNFIKQSLENTEESISTLSYLTEQEENQILNVFNNTTVAFPQNKTIIDLFEDQVVKTPENIAVVFEDKELSYHNLNEQSNQFANYLRKKFRIQANDLIAVKIERSELMMVAILGVLKSGAAYVPIDLNYPQDRIDYIKNDSNCKIVIDEQELQLFYKSKENYLKSNLEKINSPKDLAYIIYTSGTTGNPKGVMIAHSNTVELIHWSQQEFDATKFDIVYAATSYCFDLSAYEFFYTLSLGKKIRVLKNALEIKNYIEKEKAILINTVPSAVRKLLEEKTPLDNVGILNMAGEALSVDIIEKLPLGQMQVYNLYGPSEDTTYSTYYQIKKSDYLSIPIGRPISNTRIYILDEALKIVPIGATGTIYVAGAGIAKGYLNKPELTAEKFIFNPFEKGTVMYNTGDLGRWLQDGIIEYSGRKDYQVKIRGYRIELGEIETKLSQYSEIIKQVIVEAKDVNGEKSLVAYYVSDEEVDKSLIRSFLQNTLPDYMVPGFYIQLENMPLTPNGKIDRKALQNITENDLIRKEYIAPRNAIEQQLVEIWQEVLNINEVGITDNFFELGGNSLVVAQVINRIHKQLNKSVTFKSFFSNLTIAQLSNQLEKDNYLAIPKAKIASSYPLTSSQYRLWIMSQFEGGSVAYNMPSAIKLIGKIDKEKFKESFRLLIDRHEILRTYFKSNEEGEILQHIIQDDINFKISEENFTLEKKQAESIFTYLQEINNEPFDLQQAPLIRASLIETKENENIFFLSMHHIIGDGWSIELLVSEIVQTYNALVNRKEIDLPELKIQYKDYAVWLKDESQQEKNQISKQFWLDQFKGEIPALDLPGFKKRPLIKTYNGDSLTHEFSKNFLDKLNTFSKQNNATLFMTLMTGVKTLLYRYSNQNDIIVGTPIAGREHPDLENQMGLYINTLAIRTHFEKENNFLDILQKEKQTLLGAYQHQKYPFDELVSQLNLKKDLSRSALFDVIVVLQNQGQLKNLVNKNELSGLQIGNYEFKTRSSQFDMSFTFIESEGLQLTIEYNTDIYDSILIKRIFNHFENLLSLSIEQPQKLIDEIFYLTNEEENQILNEFNNTAVAYPKDKTIIDLFEDQVLKTPDNMAVIFDDKELSYENLNDQSNQFANYLREKFRIQRNDLIAIKIERSEMMIVAILGILKSGAAYVPIDLNYPEDRIDYIKNDCNSKIVIDDQELQLFYKSKDEYSKSNPEKTNTQKDLAYIIYTSGTTGNPKGVMIEHGNLLFSSLSRIGYYQINRALLLSSFSFDSSVAVIWGTLLNGGALLIEDEETIKDPKKIVKSIVHHGISDILCVPSYYYFLFEELKSFKNNLKLKNIILAGEEVKLDLILSHKQEFSNILLYNEYGPTEGTVWATVTKINDCIDVVPIGAPIQGSQVYILNNHLQLLPIGVIGQIFISGNGIAKGYLNNPEITQEKFIKNPFDDNSKMYSTGDLGRWLPSGNIEFLGRIDHQVKIRGYRIELGEIENVILNYSKNLKQVVVDVKEFNHEKTLVAYLVADKVIEKSEIREFLQQKVPNYMVPSFFIFIETLPLTPNGKIDRKALQNITGNDLIRKEYIAPRNIIEQQLVEIWQEVLNIEEVGVLDDFFELGGNSLLFIKIYERFKSKFNNKINLTKFYTSSTIEQQSKIVNSDLALTHNSAKQFNNRLPRYLEYYWSKADASVSAKNISFGVQTSSRVEFNKINKAFKILSEKHTILKSTICKENENVFFKTLDSQNDLVLVKNLSHDNVLKKCSELHVEKFDFYSAPLIKGYLFEVASNDTILFFSIPHLIFDGFSLPIFWKDLFDAYTNPEDIKQLDFQFIESGFNREFLTISPNSDSQYWTNLFEKNLKPIDLYNNKLISSEENKSIVLSFKFDSSLESKLHIICKELNVSINNFFLSVIGLLIYIKSNQKTFALCFDHHSRTEDTIDQIGFWVQSIFTEIEINDSSITEFLKVVNKSVNDSISHSNVDILKMVSDTYGDDFETSLNNLKRVRFNYYDESVKNLSVDKMDFTPLNFAKKDFLPVYLHFFILRLNEGITIDIMANNNFFEEQDLYELKYLFTEVCETILKSSDQKIKNIRTLIKESTVN